MAAAYPQTGQAASRVQAEVACGVSLTGSPTQKTERKIFKQPSPRNHGRTQISYLENETSPASGGKPLAGCQVPEMHGVRKHDARAHCLPFLRVLSRQTGSQYRDLGIECVCRCKPHHPGCVLGTYGSGIYCLFSHHGHTRIRGRSLGMGWALRTR